MMLYDRHINALQRLVRHYQKGFVSFLYLCTFIYF